MDGFASCPYSIHVYIYTYHYIYIEISFIYIYICTCLFVVFSVLPIYLYLRLLFMARQKIIFWLFSDIHICDKCWDRRVAEPFNLWRWCSCLWWRAGIIYSLSLSVVPHSRTRRAAKTAKCQTVTAAKTVVPPPPRRQDGQVLGSVRHQYISIQIG